MKEKSGGKLKQTHKIKLKLKHNFLETVGRLERSPNGYRCLDSTDQSDLK